MKPSSPSLAGRAVVAVLLLVGFYVLALAVVGVLLYLLYAMFTNGTRVNGRALVAIVVICGSILWSLIPRFDKFTPPGPKLDPAEHPQFFQAIQDIAEATDQSPPVEVYIDAQINAWVANRGGVMGLGSRRIMGIGLPLLQTLTVSQFRAVLAHEFGHYHGGDTQLGPWIYQTRAVMGRTVQSLSGSAINQLFLWYGRMYLRVTHSISRQQEYAADALAADVAGARHLIDGLKKIPASAHAYDAYWKRSVSPVLNAGYHIPLIDGFATYLDAPHIQNFMADVTEKVMDADEHNPYDTHPPMPLRIEAVAHLPQDDTHRNDTPAITLLGDVAQVESALFAYLAQINNLAHFKSIPWAEIGPAVYLPMWQKFAGDTQNYVEGISPTDLPQLVQDLTPVAQKFQNVTPQEQQANAAHVIAVNLAVLLQKNGWTLHTQIHDQAFLTHGDHEVYPFKILSQLKDGTVTAEAWLAICEETGLAQTQFGK